MAQTADQDSRQLPDFIVIGAMKTGTTSLQSYLDAHPQIYMAPKELNFFSKESNWRRGVDWYSKHFRGEGQVQGEISPGYAKCHLYEDMPARMHSVVPDAKLVYVLRDPMARLISHFSHALGEQTQKRSPEEVLLESMDNFIGTSSYGFQLQQYLEYFDLSRILLVTSEQLKDDREAALRGIFSFLGVDPDFQSSSFEQVRHQSTVKVSRNAIGRAFARYPALRGLENAAKAVVPQDLYPWFAKLMGRKLSRPELSPEQRDEIVGRLLEDVRLLRRLTGRQFDEWQWPA